MARTHKVIYIVNAVCDNRTDAATVETKTDTFAASLGVTPSFRRDENQTHAGKVTIMAIVDYDAPSRAAVDAGKTTIDNALSTVPGDVRVEYRYTEATADGDVE